MGRGWDVGKSAFLASARSLVKGAPAPPCSVRESVCLGVSVPMCVCLCVCVLVCECARVYLCLCECARDSVVCVSV